MTREEFLSKAKPEVATFVRWLEENAPKLRLWENAIRGGPQLKYKHESLPKFKFNFGQLTPGGWLVQTARLSERFGKKPRPPQKICTHYLRRVKGIIGKEAGITISKGREQLYHATTGGKGVVPLDSLIRRKEEWLAIIDETIQRINDVVGKPPKSRGAPKAPGPKPRRPRKRA